MVRSQSAESPVYYIRECGGEGANQLKVQSIIAGKARWFESQSAVASTDRKQRKKNTGIQFLSSFLFSLISACGMLLLLTQDELKKASYVTCPGINMH